MKEKRLVPTGIQGLDEVLLGGVCSGNVLLVEGAAGTGKTTLGLEFIYRGVTEHDEPGLVISFELSPDKLMRDASGFGWDLASLEQKGSVKLIYTSPVVLLQELQVNDGVLMSELRRTGARRLLIDGLTPLRIYSDSINHRPYRDALHVLVESLQRHHVTAMLTRESPESEGARTAELAPEHFVCDTIITLRAEPRGRTITRSLRVAKSRGQDFLPGRHTMRLEPGNGVRVFPRAQARRLPSLDQPTSAQRGSFGVAAIDEMMGGGVYKGSVTMIAGVTGTGKTTLSVQFLIEGAKRGQKCLFVTLDEQPAQIARNADSVNLPLRHHIQHGDIILLTESPQEIELDVHFHEIRRAIHEHQIERVVIDSLGAYRLNHQDEREFYDFIHALSSYLKERLITAVFCLESSELLGVSHISQEIKASATVDNIILLNYVEVSNQLRRAVTVPKSRGSNPARDTREYMIRSGGLIVLPAPTGTSSPEAVPQLPFSSYYGVLARSPERHSPFVVEERLVVDRSPSPGLDGESQLDGHGNHSSTKSSQEGGPSS